MPWKNKKVLVTGADGFIGSHLTEKLVALGAKVTAFSFYNSFNTWGWMDTFPKKTLDKIEVFTGDIRDPNGVLTAAKDCEVIFHLAALIGIPFSYHSPDSYVDTNVKGTLNVLQAARQLGVKKVVHTSTSEVYGTAQQVPITEDHPINPQSPYAATKSAADSLALSFYRSFDLPVTVLRPFNTFGPRQSARAVIPTVLAQVHAGRKTIKMGNLDVTRDFNYVDNTVDSFLAVAQSAKTNGEVINSGSGVETSLQEMVETVREITGAKFRVQTDKKRLRPAKSEVERLVCSAQKLKNLTGWTPTVDFKSGMRKTAQWIEKNMTSYKPDVYNV
ncbi:MAG: NAD-dependent 4,6-dehydratase LegB [Candidatus Omnitrophica bacterium]|nr:NAD-dependent 4,6-dehydratase LegB [Candidatus Omnitrophota bacterium]